MRVFAHLSASLCLLSCVALSRTISAQEDLTGAHTVGVAESSTKGAYFVYYYSKTALSQVRLLKSANASYPLLPKKTEHEGNNVYMPSWLIHFRAGMDLVFISQASDSKELVLHKYRTDDKLALSLVEIAKVPEGSFDGGLPAAWMPEDFLDGGAAITVDGQQKDIVSKALSGGKQEVETVYQSKNPPKKIARVNEAWLEFNEWRRRCGLPQLKEVPEMSELAQNKANYRAFYRLQNSHDGPAHPKDWYEGCGEAIPYVGWLTCVMEDNAQEGGAGMTVGLDGQRYMVLYLRGGTRDCLLPGGRDNAPTHRTSYLSPRPWRILNGARSHHEVGR